MPQYLSPGVYVEETSFRTATIEGVSTSTAAFVGPTRFGPITGTPTILTCLADFEGIYGSIDPMEFEDAGQMTNFIGQAVRSFFDNSGALLYVSRTFRAGDSDGYARASLAGLSPAQTLSWQARYPGSEGNVTLTITLSIGPNVLSASTTGPTLRGVNGYDIVWITGISSPPSSPPAAGGAFYCAEPYLNKATGQQSWTLDDILGNSFDVSTLAPGADTVRVLRANLEVSYDGGERTQSFTGLSFDPRSTTSFSTVFAPVIPNQQAALTTPIVFTFSDASDAAGIEIAQLMLNQTGVQVSDMISGKAANAQYTEILIDGSDGIRPLAVDYQGSEDPDNPQIKTGLVALEDLPDVAIVAAPGSTFGGEGAYGPDALQTTYNLISHCENMRYRIAVLDAPDGASVSQISAWRGQLDSTYAALYYPWVRILDPISDTEINLPPSGFVAGIYARSDNEVGVHKAPANEVVTDALSFEFLINKGQQDILNPLGVNCFRFFEGRGYRLWGARTATSDTEWQYVNLRRYMNYLKHSIDNGTQSIVFQNNGPILWASTTQLITDFLYNEFVNGRLLGATKAQAFFVRCDQTTMTQNDLDNGRLVCIIGVALLRPAEFVIFRIGQFTATSTSGN